MSLGSHTDLFNCPWADRPGVCSAGCCRAAPPLTPRTSLHCTRPVPDGRSSCKIRCISTAAGCLFYKPNARKTQPLLLPLTSVAAVVLTLKTIESATSQYFKYLNVDMKWLITAQETCKVFGSWISP